MKLFQKKEEHKFTQHCNLYIGNEPGKVIIVTCVNRGSYYEEIPNAAEVINIENEMSIGEVLKKKLASCPYRPKPRTSQQKTAASPALKVSGIKTAKTFELKYIKYEVRGASNKNTIYKIESPTFKDNVELVLNFGSHENNLLVGKHVLKLHDFYVDTNALSKV